MEKAEFSAKMTHKEITEEIKRLRDLIMKYSRGEEMPPGWKYRDTLWALEHLRNKRRTLRKKGKKNV
jgi:hypothetical protein